MKRRFTQISPGILAGTGRLTGSTYKIFGCHYDTNQFDIRLDRSSIINRHFTSKVFNKVKTDSITDGILDDMCKSEFDYDTMENSYGSERNKTYLRLEDNMQQITTDYMDVPPEFVSSFGGYIGLKYFLLGVKNKTDVYTHVNVNVSIDALNSLYNLFGQNRVIYNGNTTEYEFYKEDIGYCNLVSDTNNTNSLTITCATGYKKLSDLVTMLKGNIVKSPSATWVTGVDQYNDLVTKKFSLKSIYEYDPLLYPFMDNEDIGSFAKRYAESKSSILLLIGPPGTAKTNFIRQLIGSTNDSVLLTYSNDLKKSDALFSHFYDSPEKYLIVEDADTYIEKRENGNTNMNQLLNITDGLTANPDKKVIFSTNLPSLSQVDSAIYRPGRCFGVLKFDKLVDSNLFNVADKYKVDLSNTDTKNGLTVAELFAIKNNEAETAEVVNKVSSFGFGN